MKARFVLAVLGTILLLGLIGSLAGPRWDPQPLPDPLTVESDDVAVVTDEPTTAIGTYETTATDIEIELDGATVTARLTAPVGAPPGQPGMLFMHGAGTAGHTNFTDQAQALASAGVYVLVPAKRMDTYTTSSRDYVAMARDYLVSWDLLASTPGVDPSRVGIYGESEGAWISPVAAVLEPEVAFLVQVSAPVVPPREQGAFAMDNYLRNTHVPWPVFRAIPRAAGANIPGGGFEYVDFDVAPWQQQLSQPVLMVYGTGDSSMPLIQGPQQVIDDMAVNGNDAFTLRYFAGANHGIRIEQSLAPGFTDVLAAWTLGLPGSADAAPRVAGDQPEQQYEAQPLPRPRWYADGDMLIWSVVVSALLLVIGPLLWVATALPRRRVGRRLPAPAARHTAATGLAAVAVLVVFVAYCTQVADLALNYRNNDLVVLGGWVLVQAVGALAAGVLVRSVWVARPLHPGRWGGGDEQAGVAGRILWWATHAGAVGLLLVAAYWGVYPAVV
ncbi:alpha/beta hydrolase family protein [Pseudactinotalea suaedae]|uniref:alpha/beta hydrolase family protein n=1 Tax=Pseudactinotalea suaedae TaxID=1524924 RepID=UPI001F4FB91E|nr:prolyl oligopeptidase family serine peptidase [Pseudactinotalea suaedae]